MTTRQGIYLRKSYINFFPDPIMEISKMYYPEIQSNKLAFTIPHHYLKLFKNNSFAICEQFQADCFSVCVGFTFLRQTIIFSVSFSTVEQGQTSERKNSHLGMELVSQPGFAHRW